MKFHHQSDEKSPLPSLVAEDKIVGFILGDTSGWEYGVPENTRLDTIGVDPSGQKKAAKLLMEEMVNYMKKVGVTTIYTFVNRRECGLLQVFDVMGFKRGDMINPELKIED